MATETTTLHLPTLHCDGCMSTASEELVRVGATIEESDIDLKRVTVSFDADVLSRAAIEEAMENIGFPPEPDATE